MASIINVKVGNATSRTTVAVASDTTLRQVLDDNDINYSVAQIHLDGAPLGPGDLDKTFEGIGVTSNCFLIAVTKTSNA